ncbi:MAG TPA: transcriptional regulator [Clostridiales bacterium]|nr:transcriptional regulator [Clostridiales bacterium]
MGGLSLIVTIVKKSLNEKYIDFFKLYGSSIILSAACRGTASSAILDYLGLEKAEKTILFTLAKKDVANTILKELVYTMNIDLPGAGIGMSLPISSIGSQSAMAFLEHGAQESAVNVSSEMKEEKPMTESQYSLIIVITNVGCTDMVMDAAKSANAGGGTVIHAKGTGLDKAEKFFGISLSSEKEMIFITTLTKDKNNIMKAIMNNAGMKTEAQSIVISVPVDNVVGLRSLENIENN